MIHCEWFVKKSHTRYWIPAEAFTISTCRFKRRFLAFLFYFFLFVVTFYMRPGTDTQATYRTENRTENGTIKLVNITVKDPCYLLRVETSDDVVSGMFLLYLPQSPLQESYPLYILQFWYTSLLAETSVTPWKSLLLTSSDFLQRNQLVQMWFKHLISFFVSLKSVSSPAKDCVPYFRSQVPVPNPTIYLGVALDTGTSATVFQIK